MLVTLVVSEILAIS